MMKTTFKQLLCILFAFLMVFLLVGCGSRKNQPDNTEPPFISDTPDVNDPTADDLGDIRFPDRVVRFLVRGYQSYADELFADSTTTDTVGFEIYKREAAVEERLGIDIEYKRTAESQAHGDIEELKNLVLAGNTEQYDVYSSSSYRVCPASLEGYFLPYDDIAYLDTTKSYWADYYIEQANVTDKTYVITGSAALTTVKLMACTFFNQQLMNDLSMEDPYTLVDEKKWTLEKLEELSSQVYGDKNGNGMRDASDLYGLSFSSINGITVDAFTSACDLGMVKKNDDGGLNLVVNKTRFQNVTERLSRMMWADNTWHDGNFKATDQGDCVNFGNNLRVFMLGAIYMTGYSSFIDMSSKYGILPYPKYDSAQEQYYSYVEDQVSVFAVVKHSPNTDMIGAVLEAMGSYSYKHVMPAYYDILLKGRYLKEPHSAEIIDMMAENIQVDAAWCYNSEIKGLASLMRSLVQSKYPYFSSSYDAGYDSFKEYVEMLVD